MSRALATLALLLASSAAGATPLPSSGGPPPAGGRGSLQAQADNFAQQFLSITSQVSFSYVRPVAEKDLLFAGLTGLYEAARVSVPRGLKADIERSKTPQELFVVASQARAGLGECEALRGPNALLAACRAMAASLDPFSAVVTTEEYRRGVGEEVAFGIGVEISEARGPKGLTVKTVSPGSPAQRVGLRPNDVLTAIGGKPVAGLSPTEAAVQLNGVRPGEKVRLASSGPSSSITLTYQRGSDPNFRKVALAREPFQAETVFGVIRQPDHSWDFWIDRPGKLAQVRLAAIGSTTPEELQKALAALRQEGMRGLLLDLRWCPGGLLNESVAVARLFLGVGIVASIRSRLQGENHYHSQAGDKFLDFPVVVLINGDASGGAELIAAALQDSRRAVVAGQRSRGKASVQSAPTGLPIPGTNAGIKLTSGTFLRPSGKNLHRFPDSKPADDWGVRPDAGAEFRTSPELARQLREWWLLQTLRPGPSRELLPLDDPDNDPQRQAALRVLRDLINKTRGEAPSTAAGR